MGLFYTNTEVDMELDRKFLMRLWRGEPTTCPKCASAELRPLHKRRKDKDDWQCPACGEIYRTIRILGNLLDEGK